MANKFTQSVLQRLEQEQAKGTPAPEPATTVTPPKPLPKTVTNTRSAKQGGGEAAAIPKKVTKSKTEPRATKEESAKPEPPSVSPEIPDLSAYLDLKPARQAKNKTFYLDTDVIDAITHAAQQQGIADSRLVNDILRRVLGLG